MKAILKRFAKKFVLLDNFCHLCGRKTAPWRASNSLWNKVNPKHEILCWDCFYQLASDKGVHVSIPFVTETRKWVNTHHNRRKRSL